MKILTTIFLTATIAISYSQCPTYSSFDNFDDTDGGSPGCTATSWKHEQSVSFSGSPSGDCLVLGGTTCDISWYSERYNLNCAFCVDFDFTLSTLTSDGIAFNMSDFSTRGGNFPCSTPIGCGVGGNIGYNNLNNTNTGGSLTVEFDVFDNTADGDADLPCDHVAIVEDGNNNTFVQRACTTGINMDDGNPHAAQICWDPTTNQLTVKVDGTTFLTLNTDIRSYFSASPAQINFGLSSGYNGSFLGSNTVCDLNITPGPMNADELNFSAKLKNKNIELAWSNPDNIKSKYEILRSNDGINYKTIASQYSLENQLNYTLIDYEPYSGNNYYKIREEIIHSGIVTESTPKIVSIDNNLINIVHHKKSLAFHTDTRQQYKVEIYNTIGELVLQNEFKGSETINLLNLNDGIYIVNIISEDSVFSKKIYLSNQW